MHQHHRAARAAAGLLLAALTCLPGCVSLGPDKVPLDRTSYNSSITESWKQQILLNIVKIRYVEPLFFVDIGDIVAGYTLETGGSLGFMRTWIDPKTLADSSGLDLGVTGKYTDRPTITYKPMSGAPFRRAVMSPMPLRNALLGIESGMSANFLVNLGVRSINSLRNENIGSQTHQPAGQGFRRAVDLLSQLQAANAVHMRFIPGSQVGEGRLYLVLGGVKPSEQVRALVAEFQQLLDLDPAVNEYEVVSSPQADGRRCLVIQTYSMMQIMAQVAARVDVPPEDVASGLAIPSLLAGDGGGILKSGAVRHSQDKPTGAFAAVSFHGHWFWVDDHDLATKRVFSFLMLAFTLMEENRGSTPLQLTIPAQ